uniref:BHLH domain-containing protein n=1 Tax=Macrostomum lignano TaxID=282301 RepID=A0A1I8GZM3_9PLAT
MQALSTALFADGDYKGGAGCQVSAQRLNWSPGLQRSLKTAQLRPISSPWSHPTPTAFVTRGGLAWLKEIRIGGKGPVWGRFANDLQCRLRSLRARPRCDIELSEYSRPNLASEAGAGLYSHWSDTAIDAGLRSAAGHLTGWREISDPVEASKALPPDGDEAEVGRGAHGLRGFKSAALRQLQNQQNAPVDAKREKSRDAARHRRGRENLEFLAVARLLPLHPEIARQLDKASVIRLAVSYLKLRQLSSTGLPSWCRKPDEEEKKLKKQPEAPDLGGLILQAVDGFLMILGTDLTILYISETVSIFLGQSQVDMTGNDLVGYVHTADHAGLIDHTEKLMGRARDEHVALSMENICVRLRSNLGKRNAQVPISGYRTVQLHCQRRVDAGSGQPLGLVALATALPSLALSELYLPANSCVLRLDENFCIVLGDTSKRSNQDMNVSVPSSLYQYIFPQHLEAVRSAHQDVMKLGQTLTLPVGWMPQKQQQQQSYLWVQFCMNALFESKAKQSNRQPKAIIAPMMDRRPMISPKKNQQATSTATPVLTRHWATVSSRQFCRLAACINLPNSAEICGTSAGVGGFSSTRAYRQNFDSLGPALRMPDWVAEATDFTRALIAAEREPMEADGLKLRVQTGSSPLYFCCSARRSALPTASSMPPTMKKATSGRWSSSPDRIFLKPLIVSFSGTSLPSWPVNTSAIWKGCDRKRWILRARETVRRSSSDSSSMPRMAMMSCGGGRYMGRFSGYERAVILQDLLHAAGHSVVLLADNVGIQDAGGRVQRVHGRVDAQLGDAAGQHGGGVQMGKGGGGRRVGQIVGRHMACTEVMEPFLVVVIRSCMVPISGLGEAEDVVDEQQHILAFLVAEVLGHGQARQGHASPGTWRLIHLAVHQRHLGVLALEVDHASHDHLVVQIVALAGALAHAGEHGVATVSSGHVVDELHDEHSLAHAGAAEQANLAAPGVGRQQVHHLDAGLQDLLVRAHLNELRRLGVD